jgi:hypothetical protein
MKSWMIGCDDGIFGFGILWKKQYTLDQAKEVMHKVGDDFMLTGSTIILQDFQIEITLSALNEAKNLVSEENKKQIEWLIKDIEGE